MTDENKKKLFNYTLKLTDPIVRVNLPYVIHNTEELKVKFVRYITAQANQRVMFIKITNFNTNVYFDGSNILHYTKAIALPPSTSTPVIYESLVQDPDAFVEKVTTQQGIHSLYVEVYIDGQIASDISDANPLLMEILIA